MTPPHYAGKVTPWDLERSMRSTGNLFADARRTDIIEYAFRIKGDRDQQISDLRKIIHCAQAAIEELNAPGQTPEGQRP